MNHRTRLSGLLCITVSLIGVSGCRSAPTRLHSLTIMPSALGAVAYAGPPVRVDGVDLPPELDRSEITTLTASGEIEIHELDQWAAPLSKMARQTLTADLITRLPPGKVVVAPLDKPAGALGLNVVILEYNPESAGLKFAASWEASAGKSSAGESHLITLKAGAAGTPSEVAQRVSEALAQIADGVATQLAGSLTPPR